MITCIIYCYLIANIYSKHSAPTLPVILNCLQFCLHFISPSNIFSGASHLHNAIDPFK